MDNINKINVNISKRKSDGKICINQRLVFSSWLGKELIVADSNGQKGHIRAQEIRTGR